MPPCLAGFAITRWADDPRNFSAGPVEQFAVLPKLADSSRTHSGGGPNQQLLHNRFQKPATRRRIDNVRDVPHGNLIEHHYLNPENRPPAASSSIPPPAIRRATSGFAVSVKPFNASELLAISLQTAQKETAARSTTPPPHPLTILSGQTAYSNAWRTLINDYTAMNDSSSTGMPSLPGF